MYDLTAGTVKQRISNDDFDIPTTIDDFGHRLYAVNARFDTAPTPDTASWITAVPVAGRQGRHS